MNNEEFFFFLRKLTERLIIITQHNIAQNLNPCETDRDLLEELVRFYDESTLPWAIRTDTEAEKPKQLTINSVNKSVK